MAYRLQWCVCVCAQDDLNLPIYHDSAGSMVMRDSKATSDAMHEDHSEGQTMTWMVQELADKGKLLVRTT